LGLVLLAVVSAVGAADKIIVFNDNGGWCWFQDERVIARGDLLLIGSVADKSGTGGAERDGNIEVVIYDVSRGTAARQILAPGLQPADDHNAPAFLTLPDERTLAVYSRHGNDQLMRWRIAAAGGLTNWTPEQTADLGARVTYSNLFQLSAEGGRLYNFHRGRGFDPNVAISGDGGRSWSYFAHLLENPNDPQDRIRPYLKYASNGRDTVHLVATEAHPFDATPTSLYHGFIREGKVYSSDGTLLQDLKVAAVDPVSLTRVFAGDVDHRAWPCDLELDRTGNPVVVYSVHVTDTDHRYRYARLDGTRWNDHEIGFAGTRLYERERHYTGLASINPARPEVVYISADVDPTTGKDLISAGDGKRHYEIFKGVTPDRGASWKWSPVTRDSTADNIRPIVPAWDGKRTAVLWLRGTYTSYTDYDLDVVGVIQQGDSH